MAHKRTFGLRRRELLAAAVATASASVVRAQPPAPSPPAPTRLADAPIAQGETITVERRDDIVLVGLNRTMKHNRLDGAMRRRLGEVLFAYEHDPSLRAAVLFGHGERFSRGVDVDDAQVRFQSPAAATSSTGTIDILGKATPPPGKPVICVVHGDTWNLGHEIYLACDIRIAAANTEFGQDENAHGRFPGGGATVRFVREAGWGKPCATC
jgi:enoyl-CoA hydratase/carnithine racemase